jgi:propionyl-CoA synthetase
MTGALTSAYEPTYRRSIDEPEAFWAEIGAGIAWERTWDRVLDDDNAPLYRWYVGGRLNTCYNAVDRHVEAGHGDRDAIIYDSAMTGIKRRITYKELQGEVATFAGTLRGLGVEKGDRVVIYMPMVPEAAVAMLACARLGAVHSVVFGGFAPKELAKRIDDAQPKVVVSATCGLEPNRTIAYKPLLDEAIELAVNKPERCVILRRPECEATLVAGRDVWWDEAVVGVEPAECVTVEATDPLYVLYTSGTTGVPKGVLRDNGGHAAALAWSMKTIYDIEPGDVFWAASDIGWVVGHSYIVYGPLLAGATTLMYEGKPVGTPNPGAFWRLIEDYNVKVLFTAPTAFRAIKRDDPECAYLKGHDISTLKFLFLAGERCDPDTLNWARDVLHVPVIDHWWQTETGWAMAADCAGLGLLPVKDGSPTKPVPGWDLRVLDDQGNEVEAGTIGNIVVKLPLPPGALPTLFHNDEGYRKSYLTSLPGVLRDLGRRLHRRGRVRLHHEPRR